MVDVTVRQQLGHQYFLDQEIVKPHPQVKTRIPNPKSQSRFKKAYDFDAVDLLFRSISNITLESDMEVLLSA